MEGKITVNIDALYRARWDDTVTDLTRLLKNRADAEEVTAEAFTKLASRDTEPRNPAGLLWVTARSLAIDRLRLRDARKEVLCDDDALEALVLKDFGPGRFDGIADIREAESRADLTLALAELNAADLEAWGLTELRGLTTYEAAAVLGVSQPTVSRRAESARLTLKENL
jgi:RNA polymerase sigma factor (sigma-70 family)